MRPLLVLALILFATTAQSLAAPRAEVLVETLRKTAAIARIGTPRAVAFLVEELLRKRETNNQVDGAIERLGEKAVPDLVRIYQKDEGWEETLEEVLRSVFRVIGKRCKTAIDPLLEIANDETAAPSERARAVAVIGTMRLAAERAVPDLVKLQQNGNEDIRAAAEFSIANIGTAEAVPILLKRVGQSTSSFDRMLTIRPIGWMGTRGKSAGPAVMKYLADDDGDVRIAA
jgi:HEAT repeat protein